MTSFSVGFAPPAINLLTRMFFSAVLGFFSAAVVPPNSRHVLGWRTMLISRVTA
ncbi:hypothetical protein BDV25DRAFT_165982 [Aspergillus avenaceus]|uniref:Uncharacterized protein n=1 Tax=Aspergillus avenaceus TaxID=36643 RepID=A0A5N6TEQ8_ASPAV|nr:hypothetical protein BDV25DRAFT_165982 [Aspergillus avenaceus]